MAPADALAQDPLPHAVAVQPLAEVATASQNGGHSLPSGVTRFAVTIDGTESEEQVASLKNSEAAMALLQIAPGVSQVHASRRIFELLQRHDINIAVIHLHRSVDMLDCCSSSQARRDAEMQFVLWPTELLVLFWSVCICFVCCDTCCSACCSAVLPAVHAPVTSLAPLLLLLCLLHLTHLLVW